jgi:hypothetical protein
MSRETEEAKSEMQITKNIKRRKGKESQGKIENLQLAILHILESKKK